MNLRPLGIGELLDASVRVCITHRWTLLKIVLFVVVPVQVLSVVVTASTTPEGFSSNPFDLSTDPAAETIEGSDFATFAAGQAVVNLLAVFMFLVGSGACFRALTEAWLGLEPSWRESLRFALRRSPALVWVSIVYGFALIIAFLLLIVPFFWALVAFAFVYPIVLVERIGGVKALRRSAGLVRGRWWITFAVLLVGYVLALIVSGIAQFAISLPVLIAVDSDLLGLIFTALGATLGFVITTPFLSALVALTYFDLRVRKEGLDLQLIAERLGAAGPAAPAQAPEPLTGPAPAAPDGVPGAFDPSPGTGWLPPTPDR